MSGEWFAPVSQFAVLQGTTDTSLGGPVALTQDLRSVFNAGVAAEYWLGGVTAQGGPSSGGTALYGAFHTDFSASPDVSGNEASTSNQNWYHVTGGTAFSLGSSRFSLGVEYSFGKKTATSRAAPCRRRPDPRRGPPRRDPHVALGVRAGLPVRLPRLSPNKTGSLAPGALPAG